MKLDEVVKTINTGMLSLGFKRDASGNGMQLRKFYISLGGISNRNTTRGTAGSARIGVDWTLSIRVQYPASIPEEKREQMIAEDWKKIIPRFYGEHDLTFDSAYIDYKSEGDTSNVIYKLPDYLIKEVING